MKNLLVAFSLAALGACSSPTNSSSSAPAENVITSNDFESLVGWGTDINLLERGRAHSGKYSIKVDPAHEFSLTFDVPLGQATPAKIKTVELEGWAYLPSERATGVLGVQIIEPATGQQVFGDGIKLKEAVNGSYNTWVHVKKEVVLPDNITAMQHIRISLWRADATDVVLVDDVKLSIKN